MRNIFMRKFHRNMVEHFKDIILHYYKDKNQLGLLALLLDCGFRGVLLGGLRVLGVYYTTYQYAAVLSSKRRDQRHI